MHYLNGIYSCLPRDPLGRLPRLRGFRCSILTLLPRCLRFMIPVTQSHARLTNEWGGYSLFVQDFRLLGEVPFAGRTGLTPMSLLKHTLAVSVSSSLIVLSGILGINFLYNGSSTLKLTWYNVIGIFHTSIDFYFHTLSTIGQLFIAVYHPPRRGCWLGWLPHRLCGVFIKLLDFLYEKFPVPDPFYGP